MAIEFEMDASQVERLVNAGREAVHRTLELSATEFWRNMRIEAPVDTGRLAGSFILEPQGPFAYRITSGVRYAWFVHEGRGPGPVPFGPIAEWAKRKGLPAGPIWMAIRSAGTKANPYSVRAWDKTKPRIREFGEQAIREMQR